MLHHTMSNYAMWLHNDEALLSSTMTPGLVTPLTYGGCRDVKVSWPSTTSTGWSLSRVAPSTAKQAAEEGIAGPTPVRPGETVVLEPFEVAVWETTE